MCINNLLKEYFNQMSKFKVNEILWIPSTKIGVHPLEMKLDVLHKMGAKYIKSIERNIKYLKKHKLKKEHSCVSYPDSLYHLIESWNLNALMGFSREMNELELQYFQEMDVQYFYSVIYHNILRGRTDKRDLRLHFKDVSLPITMKCYGTIKSVPLNLKSISKRGMLFEVNSLCKFMMEMANGFEISLDHRNLLECWDEPGGELAQELMLYSPRTAKVRRCRSKKFSVNMDQVFFSSNSIDKAKSLGYNDHHFLCVPFEALEDPILLDTADYGKVIGDEIDHFEESLNEILLAA